MRKKLRKNWILSFVGLSEICRVKRYRSIMETQESFHYRRIAKAIHYIQSHFRKQPRLDAIADHVGLSPAHFQRLFISWVGTSPKQFLRYVNMLHLRKALSGKNVRTLAEIAYEVGLSSTSRLHDLFVSVEGMTPAEYKHGGRNLQINYTVEYTLFGPVLVASTPKGICQLSFLDEMGPPSCDEAEFVTNEDLHTQGMQRLKSQFPNAVFRQQSDHLQRQALAIFRMDWEQLPQIRLHLKGTQFQLRVWECLLRIPRGYTATYGAVAERIGAHKAARAVGTAIGTNPIAFLIPCHRVIRGDGSLGGYRWDTARKRVLLAWETATPEGILPIR